MKTIIHVNQHVIKANRKHGKTDPVLTVKTYKSNDYGHGAIIYDKEGEEVARVIYRPDKPLSCGAHVWIETQNEVSVVLHSEEVAPDTDWADEDAPKDQLDYFHNDHYPADPAEY